MYPLSRIVVVFLVLFMVLAVQNGGSRAIAQQKAVDVAEETRTQIPILNDFHMVIAQMWHTAWPAKDVAMLVSLLPEIERYADSLHRVTLPGILRDKKSKWDEKTRQLGATVAQYKAATSPVDTAALLLTAEKLHMQYEGLVRVTRPVLKEVDEFHQVLYMLYHHYLPEKDYDRVASSVKELREKMVPLGKLTLPDRLKNREQSFVAARTRLTESVNSLNPDAARSDSKKFSSALEELHTHYQELERVLE